MDHSEGTGLVRLLRRRRSGTETLEGDWCCGNRSNTLSSPWRLRTGLVKSAQHLIQLAFDAVDLTRGSGRRRSRGWTLSTHSQGQDKQGG
jgi:hypothetical protein